MGTVFDSIKTIEGYPNHKCKLTFDGKEMNERPKYVNNEPRQLLSIRDKELLDYILSENPDS